MLEVRRDVMRQPHLKVLGTVWGVAVGQRPWWHCCRSTPSALGLHWWGGAKRVRHKAGGWQRCLRLCQLPAAAGYSAVPPALLSSSIVTNTMTLITATLSSMS